MTLNFWWRLSLRLNQMFLLLIKRRWGFFDGLWVHSFNCFCNLLSFQTIHNSLHVFQAFLHATVSPLKKNPLICPAFFTVNFFSTFHKFQGSGWAAQHATFNIFSHLGLFAKKTIHPLFLDHMILLIPYTCSLSISISNTCVLMGKFSCRQWGK